MLWLLHKKATADTVIVRCIADDPRSCEGALKRLQRPAIDLFVYRGPPPADGPSIEETMEECKVRWHKNQAHRREPYLHCKLP